MYILVPNNAFCIGTIVNIIRETNKRGVLSFHTNLEKSNERLLRHQIILLLRNLIFLCISQHLKGKFSSGIEGALASTLNHDFNWKQLSAMILCIFYVFKVYLSNIDSETAEI